MRSQRGFTLIELLLVIAIVALLATLIVPVIQGMKDKSNDLQCRTHLRDLFVMLTSAATENDGRYPEIEIDIENPVHADNARAKPLLETLRPYGAIEKTLQCPADLAGP